MQNPKSIYDANFTVGVLFASEFQALKPIITGKSIKKTLEKEIQENNHIGINTLSARKRIVLEINRRIDKAPKNFWDFFYNLEHQKEKNLALFYLCLKTYPLIFDLHFEVAVKKYKTIGTLSTYDIQMRLDEIASIDQYVENWSERTLKNLNKHYRKAIKDAELYDGKNLIRTRIVNPGFWNYFSDIGDNWFAQACFLNF